MSNRHRISQHTYTRTPYDDVVASERRWGHLRPDEIDTAARADPLRFLADHIPGRDREQGALALFGDLGPIAEPVLVTVHDAPSDPTVEECALLVWRFADYVDRTRMARGEDHFGIGLVHHRVGSTVVCDLDRRWLLALEALAPEFGYSIVGVMARTEAGALVNVAHSAELA